VQWHVLGENRKQGPSRERHWRKGQEKNDRERERRKEESGKPVGQQMEVDLGGGRGNPQGSLHCGAVTKGSREREGQVGHGVGPWEMLGGTDVRVSLQCLSSRDFYQDFHKKGRFSFKPQSLEFWKYGRNSLSSCS